MKINVSKRSRRLETISEGDILIFSNRKETVSEVDIHTGKLYTERVIKNKDKDSEEFPFNKEYPFKKEKVVYGSNGNYLKVINNNCIGHVYDYIKIKKLK